MGTTTTVILQQGDTGDQVSQLQTLLQSLGYYNGTIDGDFGPGTQAAVMQFQQAQGLTADGVAGPQTLGALANAAGSSAQTTTPTISTTAVVNAPATQDTTSLAYRCLSLTGAFETSKKQPDCFAAIAGNFDGMGMSFGCLQWNWGQKTLQPLLQQMDQQNSSLIDEYFGVNAATLRQVLGESLQQQLSWLNTIQDSGFHIQEPWRDQFSALGYDENFQQIEVNAAQQRFTTAQSWCSTYSVTSERAVALMFDINVQDGSISQATQQLILQDIQNLQSTGDSGQDEVNKLVIIANRRADAANPAAQADVRARKLTIANGTGTVHGITYNIQNDFGITLNSAL